MPALMLLPAWSVAAEINYSAYAQLHIAIRENPASQRRSAPVRGLTLRSAPTRYGRPACPCGALVYAAPHGQAVPPPRSVLAQTLCLRNPPLSPFNRSETPLQNSRRTECVLSHNRRLASSGHAGRLWGSFPRNFWPKFEKVGEQDLHLQSVRHEGRLMKALLPRISLLLLTSVVAAAAVAGCSAEVASTAATSAKLQATQAEQAKAQEAQFKKKLGEAMQATEAAASAAGNQ